MEGMTDGENVILGVASASLVAVTLQPTLYWKNAAAHGLPFTLRPSLLFRGCGVNLLKESSEMALQFAVAGRMKSGGGGCSLSSAAREMSGAIGGGTFGALLVTPFECVMIQQQLHGTSLLATPSRIARRFGVLSGGLYRGLAIAASRDAIYVGGMLGLTPVVRRYLVREGPHCFLLLYCSPSCWTHRPRPRAEATQGCSQCPPTPSSPSGIPYFPQVEDRGLPSTRAGMLAAAVGGVAGGVLSHPWDVVKTCMQGDLERIRYGTASQVPSPHPPVQQKAPGAIPLPLKQKHGSASQVLSPPLTPLQRTPATRRCAT